MPALDGQRLHDGFDNAIYPGTGRRRYRSRLDGVCLLQDPIVANESGGPARTAVGSRVGSVLLAIATVFDLYIPVYDLGGVL